MKTGKMEISGFVETYLTDEKGNKKKIGEGKNYIIPAFYAILAANLDVYADIALDDPFVSTVIAQYKDGMAAMSLNPTTSAFVEYIALISTVSNPAPASFRIVGVLANSTGATLRISQPHIGKSWTGLATVLGSTFNDFVISTNVGWTVTDIPTGTTLTVTWTITFTPH